MKFNSDLDLQAQIHSFIPQSEYLKPATEVARHLLGKLLVREYQGSTLVGVIVETEAYQGEDDLGCHAKAGWTPRTSIMYGPPGHAYVYFTYGMHWLLNVVTGEVGSPAAVLIRAVEPLAGLDVMRILRPPPRSNQEGCLSRGWTDGPAKCCQAFSVNGRLNGVSLCGVTAGLWIADAGFVIHEESVEHTARIGLNSVPEPWRSIPWRYVLKQNHPVSALDDLLSKNCSVTYSKSG
ncbi:MAG: 3-methyladenine DNA glycosylase [Anaerolinea sp.]|nr:3-methyladenine DNA glycosylase [Anaerolinea sp.]